MKPQWWVATKTLADEAIKVPLPRPLLRPSLMSATANSRRRAPHSPRSERSRVVPLAARQPGLVHLASALVGTSRAGVLCAHGGCRAGCAFFPSRQPFIGLLTRTFDNSASAASSGSRVAAWRKRRRAPRSSSPARSSSSSRMRTSSIRGSRRDCGRSRFRDGLPRCVPTLSSFPTSLVLPPSPY